MNKKVLAKIASIHVQKAREIKRRQVEFVKRSRKLKKQLEKEGGLK